ncbi:MAG TPA: bifunctional lysylphosphatidylglycerol flippase/synthetase MprF [Verrucomicrobiae bacterium]|nr:bifunctional lysylphosphatidylglycerol flippase/synthetase MprF [Verrucomicrobiae bacterium]
MKKFLLRVFHSLGFVFFIGGLWVLYRELGGHHFNDVTHNFADFPKRPLLAAALFTAFNYAALTSYEWLGLRYIRKPMKYAKIFPASFIASALGNNFGAVALSGAAVRYRMYSTWGLSALETAQVILFYSVSFFLGLIALLGFSFVTAPGRLLPGLQFLSPEMVRMLGIAFLAAVLSYLLACGFVRRSFKIKDWELRLPEGRLALGQAFFSLADWLLAAAVLYVLLPQGHGLSYLFFVGLFITGHLLGMVSQVPGGLGVFEATLLAALSDRVPSDQLFVSLLYYRLIYYLLPLFVSLLFLAVLEFKNLRKYAKAGAAFNQILTPFVPPLLSVTTFIAGTVLLLSGSTPAVGSRLAMLERFLPLPAIELSHFLGSLAGVLLLFLARGIQRRLDAAYYFALILLGFGMVFSLMKGFDYEEAVILFAMFLLIVPSRPFFYRKASLFGEALSPAWLLSVLTVISVSVWLGLFAFKHVNYSGDLWWHFSLRGDAARSMRAVVGVMAFAGILSAANLMRTTTIKVHPPSPEELSRALDIIVRSSNTTSYLALSGDKNFLFSRDGLAFIMYGVQGKSWVSLGDPIGDSNAWLDLITSFRMLVDRHDGMPVFYEVNPQYLPLYLDAGFALIKMGEEGRVFLPAFSLEGGGRKEMRYTLRRMEKEGASFEWVDKEAVPGRAAELKTISDAWLAKKNTKEKGFSLGFFDVSYLRHFPMAVMRYGGKPVAFANVMLGAEKSELSVDLMRYDPDLAPAGSMDYLFLNLFLWGKEQGYQWFNVGMAPLAGLENREFAPLWNKLGAFIFSRGEYFYNFEGLRDYKEKFGPQWRPKYIALPGGFSVPRALADIASLNSRGLKGIFSK